jgi:hypothetical protein
MTRPLTLPRALLFALCLVPFSQLQAASSSVLLTYQGRVKSGGTDFSGMGQFKFALVAGTNLNRQATAVATVTSGFLTGIQVVDGGSGYVTAPAITIIDSTGSGAIAVASVGGGRVTAINVSNAGTGYSAVPTIRVGPPPPNVTFTTFWSNDGSSKAGGEPLTAVGIPVNSGLFIVALGDSGLANMGALDALLFTQPNLQLRVWFSDGGHGFSPLDPPQPLTVAPYAGMALNASNLLGTLSATQLQGVLGSGSLSGFYSSPVYFNNPENQFSGYGAMLSDLNASALSSGTVPEARLPMNIARSEQVWLLGGNSGTAAGTHYLGTADRAPMQIKVGGLRVWRAEDSGDSFDGGTTPDGAPNLIGGSPSNSVAAGLVGVTIAGGGATNHNGRPRPNTVASDFCTIGGGLENSIAGESRNSVIAGGLGNEIYYGADSSVIGGGSIQMIGTNASHSVIAGGEFNSIGDRSIDSTIAGGLRNHVDSDSFCGVIGGGNRNAVGTNSPFAFVGGGEANEVANNSSYAIIPGGRENYATNSAFAAGSRAKALHTGAFVWGDTATSTTSSTNKFSVTMRASGGYRFFTSSGTAGAYLAAGSGSWTTMSDRNGKENFQPVDTQAVLSKVAALPLATWNYKTQPPEVRHIGPAAQDFHAAFSVGESDTGITSVDADGVALAAIQALDSALKEKAVRIQALERDVDELRALVRRLAQRDEQVPRAGP